MVVELNDDVFEQFEELLVDQLNLFVIDDHNRLLDVLHNHFELVLLVNIVQEVFD